MINKIFYTLILLLIVSCNINNDYKLQEILPKYRISVDDGNGNGILSITHYKSISYEFLGENGVKFITLDGKEHFTTYKTIIREL